MSGSVVRFCECDSFDCMLEAHLSLEESMGIYKSGLILIVKGCQVGPNPTDNLVGERNNYSLYSEG